MYFSELFSSKLGYNHSHCSSVYSFKNDLYCVWYSYPEKEHCKAGLFISKSTDDGKNWQKPQLLTPRSDSSYGNPILFEFKNKLYIFYSVIEPDRYWNDAKLFVGEILDQQMVSSRKLQFKDGILARHKPIQVSDSLIFPLYDEASMTSIFYKTSDLENFTDIYHTEEKLIQADFFSPNQYEIHAYFRSAEESRLVKRVISPDQGKTWSNIISTKAHCPLSGIAACYIKGKKIILVNNNTDQHKRSPLNVMLSVDNGINFKEVFTLEIDPMEFSYPSIINHKDMVIISYTYNRKHIKICCFQNEEFK